MAGVFELCTRGGEDDDCDAEPRDVLLKTDVSVAGDEHIELFCGEREQATVLDASPFVARRLPCVPAILSRYASPGIRR